MQKSIIAALLVAATFSAKAQTENYSKCMQCPTEKVTWQYSLKGSKEIIVRDQQEVGTVIIIDWLENTVTINGRTAKIESYSTDAYKPRTTVHFEDKELTIVYETTGKFKDVLLK